MHWKRMIAGLLLATLLPLGGCGLFGWLDRSDVYVKSEPSPPLEVPPDLSQPIEDPGMDVPDAGETVGGTVSGEAPEPPDLDDTPLPEAPEVDLPRDEEGAPYIALEDSLDSAWRRTGFALERSGFSIVESDDARRLYSVRYAPPSEDEDDGGFFDWLFGGDEDENGAGEQLYHVSLVGAGEGRTNVTVLNAAGETESGTTAERILALLAERLKS